jgi:murein L,D-transpeptidase YcbB/YkuD
VKYVINIYNFVTFHQELTRNFTGNCAVSHKLNAGIMKPTEKATSLTPCSCKTSVENSIVNWTKKALLFTVRFITFAGLFILSTSYQGHRKELLLMENEMFLPALKDNMTDFFRQMNSSGSHALYNTCFRTLPLINDFYSKQNYRPVWTNNTVILDQAVVLLGLLDKAELYGLKTSLFPVREIRNEMELMKNRDIRSNYLASRMNLEFLLTDACLRFMVFLKMGYHEFDSTLFSLPAAASLPLDLISALASNDFENRLLSIQPAFIEYRKLQQALVKFLCNIERDNVRISVPDPSKDSALFRKKIEEVLINLGYLQPGSTDDLFITSLKKFQYCHGLDPDGKPGKNTRESLVQSTEDRYRQIALNLDRLRKENLRGEQFIYVNIPAYQMRIYKMNVIIGNSKVIVGAAKTPTPLVSSKIERIITNQEWQVPRSITLDEMLPKLKSDSGYLNRNRLRMIDKNRNTVAYNQVDWNTVSAETFDLIIKQESGKDNSLGCVKFVFPNPYSIFLHDTPAKQSFSKDFRALSHGCVRVEHPEMLADYLVREFSMQNHDVDIISMINNGIHKEIALNIPVDLYIHYLTCEADEELNIFFYKDIYGIDEIELKKLEFLQ